MQPDPVTSAAVCADPMNYTKRFCRRHKNQIYVVTIFILSCAFYLLFIQNKTDGGIETVTEDLDDRNVLHIKNIQGNNDVLKLNENVRHANSFYLQVDKSDASIHHIVKREVSNESTNISMVLFSSWTKRGGTVSKGRVYRNIIRNWKSFYPAVQPLVFTADHEVYEIAVQNQWFALPEKSNKKCAGPPLLPHMFVDAKAHVPNAFLYGFSNADILFSDNLMQTLKFLENSAELRNKSMMIIGRRTNYDFHLHPQEFISKTEIDQIVSKKDQVQKSSDYFFTTKDFPWDNVAPLSIGRPAFCRWVMSYAHKIGAIVIDTTITVSALHLTTEDGNKSSWHLSGNGVHCNEDIIESFPEKVILGLGWVECAIYETYFDKNGEVQLRTRDVQDPSCPKPYSKDQKPIVHDWKNV